MKFTLRMVAAATVAALLGGPRPAESRADFALGVTLFGNQLISIDTATGNGTLVGSLSTPMTPFGLASYRGSVFTFDSTNGLLRQLNTATGATVASVNTGIGHVIGQGGLAIRADGVGFVTNALDSAFRPVNNLYAFNVAGGSPTLIGHTTSTLEALAFSGTTLYGLGKADGNLYTINTTTAALSLVGNTGVTFGSGTGGLTFGPGGTLYATINDALYTINVATGVARAVNPDPNVDTGFSSISGLTFAVPEPSSVALLAVGVAALGLMIRRRADRSRIVKG